jgi:endonuclease YncB( thermonuclease family)
MLSLGSKRTSPRSKLDSAKSNPDERLGKPHDKPGPQELDGGYRRAVMPIARLAVVSLVVVLLAAVADNGRAGSDANSRAVIARVIDGDTVALTNGERVRLVQIDTPEVGGGECYSQAARKALLRLTPVGTTVVLEADPKLDSVDRYGRLLRYIKRRGINVNIRLVLDGAAAPYFYRSEKGTYAGRLLAAAIRAKAVKRGLWGACPGTQLAPNGPVQTRQGKPTTPPPSTPPALANPQPGNCHPSYRGACLDPNASDYDCAGGSGNGPLYTGRVEVVGPDVFRLDSDGDGLGCEDD